MLLLLLLPLVYFDQSAALSVPAYQKLSPRQLFNFHSYKDVQLFHFQAPAQVKLATFAFRANETNSRCEPRNVTLYLQHGSYPVISPLGAAFPADFYLGRTSLAAVSARSDSSWLRYSVAAPLPGDWFAAGFILEDDTRITQKGLAPTCITILEAEASFTRQENVVTLVPEVTDHQRLILMHTINATQHYRFAVPAGTFSALVNVSRCVDALDGGSCPLVLSASPLALPDTRGGPFTTSANCSDTPAGGCVLPLDTAADRWHYVQLAVQRDTTIQLGIQVVLGQSCVDREHDNEYMLVSEIRTTCEGTARTAFIPVAYADAAADPDSNDSCWNSVGLARRTLSGSLAFVYDQRPVPETGRPPPHLNISTRRPTFLTFGIQPVQDIGGTLTVALGLPDTLNTSAADLSVTGCLSHWVRAHVLPDGRCSSGVRLSVNSTVGGRQQANVTNLPFPEPGDWYLTLVARCYRHQLHTSETSSVPCPDNHTAVVFHVESAPCLRARCGANGGCYQYFSGGFVFSTCVCWAGYAGWGCTDASHATSDFQLLLGTLLLTISNVLFAPAVALALRRRYYTEALVYAFTMFFSTFYHACDEQKYTFCLMRLSVMQFCDFYAGIFAFWVTLVAMADLPLTWSQLLNVGGAMLVSLGVEYDRTGLWVFVVPVVTAFVCMISSWAWRCRQQRALFPPLRYLLLGVLPGATIAGAGLVCYTLLETEDNYKYTHSAWHCCIALCILFLLPVRRSGAAGYYGLDGAGGKLVRVGESHGLSQQTVNTSSDSERAPAGDAPR